jgi:membrane protein required for colicin V production
MTWVDLIVLAVLLISGTLGFLRGLVQEVLGIGAWVGAVFFAFQTSHLSRDIVARWITDPAWQDPVGLLAAFLVALIVLSILARLLSRLVRGSGLGGVDRSLGVVFGLGRGAALVVIAYILVGMAVPIEQWPEPVLRARSLGFAYDGAAWLARQMPPEYRPMVAPPPGARAATAQGLMRTTPQGRATEGWGGGTR